MATGTITEIAGGTITTVTTQDLTLFAQHVNLHGAEQVDFQGTEGGVILGNNPETTQGVALVRTAYFARVMKRYDPVTVQAYTVQAGDTANTIARQVQGVRAQEVRRAHPRLTPGSTINLRVHNEGTELNLEKIEGAGLGADLYLVVETSGLRGQSVTIEILGSNNTTFVAPDQVVPVTLPDGTEATSLTAVVGNYTNRTEYFNAASFADKAVVQFKLAPQSAERLTEWRRQVSESQEERAFLHLRVKATTENEVTYYNETEGGEATSREQGIYVNKRNAWFEVTNCFCYRDFTEQELRDIVREMRQAERITSTAIFTAENCTLDVADKTYARLLEELNKAFKTHEIDTCIRKMHFMGQIYWEGDRLRTTLEYASGTYLDPGRHDDAEENGNTIVGDGPRYKGRGLMQLTWRNTQRTYLEYIVANHPAEVGNQTVDRLLDRTHQYTEGRYHVDGAGLIARNLFLAVDSAGWFWNQYKRNRAGQNLNDLADFGDRHTDFISRLVNGGGNGLVERRTFYERLRDNVFNFRETCANYDNIEN